MKKRQTQKPGVCNPDGRFLSFVKIFYFQKSHKALFLCLGIVCLMLFATGIQAQDIPCVYDVENTGTGYPLPPLPNL